MSSIRRVISGLDSAGRSVFVDDNAIAGYEPAAAPGTIYYLIWGDDGPVRVGGTFSLPRYHNFFPDANGFRFFISVIPPQSEIETPSDAAADEAALAEFEHVLPGLRSYMEPEAPGMHTTDTVDIDLILEGEVALELDGEVIRTVKAGEVIVQVGARHRWHNYGAAPVRMASFVVGAERTWSDPRT
jgi:mannose-6-phosphate isomerase-like protein (cupin superfamily)